MAPMIEPKGIATVTLPRQSDGTYATVVNLAPWPLRVIGGPQEGILPPADPSKEGKAESPDG